MHFYHLGTKSFFPVKYACKFHLACILSITCKPFHVLFYLLTFYRAKKDLSFWLTTNKHEYKVFIVVIFFVNTNIGDIRKKISWFYTGSCIFLCDSKIILKEILAFCWLVHVQYIFVVCFVFRLCLCQLFVQQCRFH